MSGSKKLSVAIIGGGNMGAAIVSGIHKTYRIVVAEKDAARVALLKKKFKVSAGSLDEAVRSGDVVILAVKPQDFEDVLAGVRAAGVAGKLVISIAAGITTEFIESRLGDRVRVVRAMPNMPAQIGEGITALCAGTSAKATDIKTAGRILSGIGETLVVEENLMDAVTAVSGSGPAYVFLVAECFAHAAKDLGLSGDMARRLVLATLKGSVDLLLKSGECPADLRARVTSKGGTTQAAMDVFFQNKFDDIFKAALNAARNRAGELAQK